MLTEYILTLADPRASLPSVGGKGASLARLSAAGLPVPDGFYVTTAAYQDFVTRSGLQARILESLAPVDPSTLSTLDAAERAIQALFLDAPMPAEIAAAITRAYAALGSRDLSTETPPAVAVRSSATAEDLPGLSFAGQQETYLNIRGSANVLKAVQRCWASLWTARAIGYRAQHAIASDTLSLAVVVQLLVPAEASGVLFTANPVNGQRGQAMITAAWGLGESIVGGLVTPDTLTVDKASGRLVTRETAQKSIRTVLLESGTAEQPTPAALQNAPVLTDEQAAALTRLGTQIETLYGLPVDVEWTWTARSGFAIVQARPVTALPEPEPHIEPPSAWKLPDPKGKFARGSVTDFLPDPLTPLFRTLGHPVIDDQTRRLFARMTGMSSWPIHNNYVIHDYAYVTIQYPFGLLLRVTWGGIREFRNIMEVGERSWREDALPKYRSTIARWQQRPPAELPTADLLEGARQLFEAAVYTYNMLQSGIIPASGFTELIFTQVYNRLIKKPADPAAMTFMLGFESTPIRADKALYDLAMWAQTQPELAAYLGGRRGSQIAADLRSGAVPEEVPEGAWQVLRTRLDGYLAEYGSSLYDLDFAKPLPTDDPGTLLDTLRLYLSGDGRSPYERTRQQQSKREAATEQVLSHVSGLKRKYFLKTLRNAQKMAPLREDGLADLGLGYPLLRSLLLELGGRLARSGAIAQAADVFWLEDQEIRATLPDLERGSTLPAMGEVIAQRKALWNAEKRVTPPTTLPIGSRFMGLDIGGFGARTEGQEGDTLKGIGAFPGRVSGVARVLRGPQDFDQMRPGDILVASITTPAWTPLFAMAAAIVTDIGGPLSHSSIVAREYGIPAVLGTGVATRRIHSGQTITVDGGAGLVHLTGAEVTRSVE
jgi:rifampicin phosphotransferase